MERTEMTCIVCPNGCRMVVREGPDGRPVVTGAECPKGITHAFEELGNPLRVLTSTVRVIGGICRVVPVRTAAPVPKRRIPECMEAIKTLVVEAPVVRGGVVVEDLAATGVPLIATWTVPKA